MKKWKKKNNQLAIKELSKEFPQYNPLILEILYNRGYETAEAIRHFMDYDPTDVCNPLAMTDMEKGVDVILNALKNNEHIVIYGDYDCGATRS